MKASEEDGEVQGTSYYSYNALVRQLSVLPTRKTVVLLILFDGTKGNDTGPGLG